MIDSSNLISDDNINVSIRIRPKENNSSSTLLNIYDNKIITSNISYQFDYIADENSNQNEIFEHCAKKICDYSLEGYNGTIFAYGQTGSGKTYTLFGPKYSFNNINKINNYEEDISMNDINANCNNKTSSNINLDDESIGLLPRIIYYLFNNTNNNNSNNSYTFRISYLEIYQESLSDLLNPESKNLTIRDVKGKIIVDGLRTFLLNSPEEGLKYVTQGTKLRRIACTKMNEESSRSHAIISIYIENSKKEEDGIILKKSVFHIIDLAGSERQNKTGALGERVREAGSINKSLLNLTRVIKNIINNIKPIPYRDSKLTLFLKDSLGGNAKTSIIGNISPSDSNNSETISTLNFAICAKKVKNKAIINEELSNINKATYIEFKKLKDKYNAICHENSMLKKQINNNRNKINPFDYTSIVDSVENDIEKMSKEMEQKNLEIDSKNEELIKLNDRIQKYELEIKLKEKQIDQLKEDNKKYKNENNQILEKVNLLNNNINENKINTNNIIENKNKEISDLNINLTISNDKLREKELTIVSLENNLNTYKNENKYYIDLINEKNIEINKLMLENEKLKKEFKLFNEDRNNEKNDYNNMLNENKNLKNEINNKNKEYIELKDKYSELTTKGKITIQKYDDEIKKLRENEDNLKEDLENYKKGLKDLKNLLNCLESKNYDSENQIKLLQNQNNSYLNTMNILEERKVELSKENQKLIENVKILNEKLDNNLYYINNNINNIQGNNYSKVFKIKNENLKLKNENNELQQKFDNLIKLYRNYKGNINEIAEALNNKEKELGNSRHMLHIIIDKIKEILKDTDFDISSKNFNNNDFDYLGPNKSIEDKVYYYFQKIENYIINLKDIIKKDKDNLQMNEKSINYLTEKLNVFTDINKNIKKSNKKLSSKVRASLIQQKKNYEDYKSANKENLNEKKVLNPLIYFTDKNKMMSDNSLNFNINDFFKNKYNYNISNNIENNILNIDNNNNIELSNINNQQ